MPPHRTHGVPRYLPGRLASVNLADVAPSVSWILSVPGHLVPRIPDQLQRSIVFIYSSLEAAKTGAKAGGTGFLVSKTIASGSRRTYLVTNAHVAQSADRVARLTGADGTSEFVPIASSEWVNHRDGDDIAACDVSTTRHPKVDALCWADFAVSLPRMAELNVGVGDDVFMLGRFISHGGIQQNQALARFGNIAMMPGEAVLDGRELRVEAFLVEMRSLSGFSGSPVFLYIGPGSYRGNGTMMPLYSETIGLMGIDTGHKAFTAPVRSRDAGLEEQQYEVEMNTGVAIVSPAWKIAELLDDVGDRS